MCLESIHRQNVSCLPSAHWVAGSVLPSLVPMRRRHFIQSIAAVAVAGSAGAQRTSPIPRAARPTQPRRDTLIIDAMGELRPEYSDGIVRDMLASGLDAITVTLCDPKPEGDAAFALAVDSLSAHDRFLSRSEERRVGKECRL